MSVRSNCPCDLDGVCPYESESNGSCEYWCGVDAPQDDPIEWEDGFWIHSTEKVESAPADEVWGWDE